MIYKDYQQGDQLEEQNIVCIKLTPEETQIALSFLKRRFPNYSIEKIVSTLDHYVCNHQMNHPQNRPLFNPPRRNQPIITFPLSQDNKTIEGQFRQPQRSKRFDIQSQKQESIKLIAKLFCQSGYDLKKLQTYMPQISGVYYRNYLLSIMNSILKQILTIVRQPHNKQLTQNQKYQIKTHMLSAHQWMALKDMNIFSTFLKLIQKKVLNKKSMINQKQIEDLYHLLVARIRFQCVDTTDIDKPIPIFGEQIEKPKKQSIKYGQGQNVMNDKNFILKNTFSLKQNIREQKLIGQTYLKHKSVSQTFSQLRNSLSLQKRCSSVYIQQTLISIIQKCLKEKIEKCIQEKTFGWFELIGRISPTTPQSIYDYGSLQLKIQLIQLYIYNHLNKTIFSNLISLLNVYFSQNQLYQEEDQGQIDEILAHATQFKEEQLYFDIQNKNADNQYTDHYGKDRFEENRKNREIEGYLVDSKGDEEKVQKQTNFVDENQIQYLIK